MQMNTKIKIRLNLRTYRIKFDFLYFRQLIRHFRANSRLKNYRYFVFDTDESQLVFSASTWNRSSAFKVGIIPEASGVGVNICHSKQWVDFV